MILQPGWYWAKWTKREGRGWEVVHLDIAADDDPKSSGYNTMRLINWRNSYFSLSDFFMYERILNPDERLPHKWHKEDKTPSPELVA